MVPTLQTFCVLYSVLNNSPEVINGHFKVLTFFETSNVNLKGQNRTKNCRETNFLLSNEKSLFKSLTRFKRKLFLPLVMHQISPRLINLSVKMSSRANKMFQLTRLSGSKLWKQFSSIIFKLQNGKKIHALT